MKLNEEHEYLDLLESIITHGEKRLDRTGVGTYALYGVTLEYDISDNRIPIVSTRKINPLFPILEMLWFMRGDTNVKYLLDHDCHIWDSWVIPDTAVYNNNGKLVAGSIGKASYGAMWRRWPAMKIVQAHEWHNKYAQDDWRYLMPAMNGKMIIYKEIDQLREAIRLIKNEPHSRRNIVSSWNPAEMQDMALPPCHWSYQFVVTSTGLELHLNMRSSDAPVGLVFNVAQYAFLAHVIAHITDLKATRLVYKGVDVHVYSNQVELVKKQLEREPIKSNDPRLTIKKKPYEYTIDTLNIDDIEISGYEHHPFIKYPVAV